MARDPMQRDPSTLKPLPVGQPVIAGFGPQPTPNPPVAYSGGTEPATASGQTQTPGWASDPQYAGMDPALKKIYLDSGYAPAGAGSGFADWQYWNSKPSQFDRLKSDIAGTGSDQTTGTPWDTGAWQNSGKGASAGGAGFTPGMGAFDVQSYLARFGPSAITNNPKGDELYKRLMSIADQSTNISPNDPTIKAQTDAFRAETDRGAKDYLAAAAEKGGALGNLDATARSAYEKSGQATAGFQAQAMANELTARRQQIMQALSGASGLLTSEQQMQLQEELASMDAALNESQFGRNLAERGYEYDTTTNNAIFGGV